MISTKMKKTSVNSTNEHIPVTKLN